MSTGRAGGDRVIRSDLVACYCPIICANFTRVPNDIDGEKHLNTILPQVVLASVLTSEMSPPVGLAELSLFPANRQQTIESRRRTHPQWSRGLSMEVYLRRDERLDELEHAKDGRMTTWCVLLPFFRSIQSDSRSRVLAPRDDPQTLDFLCACET